MQHAGFAEAREIEGIGTAFGRLALFSARRAYRSSQQGR
jgi:hypothetical protein